MQPCQRFADCRTVARARASDPHAVEKSNDRSGAAGEHSEHLVATVLDRLWAIDPATGQMLHKAKKERQVVGRDPSLIQRQNEIAAAGVHEEIGVLDSFRNALIGKELANVVASEEIGKILGGHVGVDGHRASYSAVSFPRSARGSGKVMSSSISDTAPI